METYIALLSGINLGSTNKISMPLLETAFEEAGFSNVSTYTNNGNVIFSSVTLDKNQLIEKCESLIADKFRLNIPVTVISTKELSDILNHAPKWWDVATSSEVIHQAIFLIPPTTVEEICKVMGRANPNYEQVGYYNNVIFWSAPIATISKTNWYRVASSSLNNKLVLRIATAVEKLLSLSSM